MKYYMSAKTIHKMKSGWPICDAFLSKERTKQNPIEVDVAIVGNCFACGIDFILEERNEHADGDFCDQCLQVHGD